MSIITRKTLFKLLLIFFTVLVLLIIFELYFYFFRPIEYLKPLKPLPIEKLGVIFFQPSLIPGLSYELVPNRSGYMRSFFVQTNSSGMRDEEPVTSETNPPHRIVAIGDSFTFGFNVLGEDTYPNVLEKLINHQNRNERFDVLNLGVGGYSTRDEAIALEQKGLKWDPELIIVGYTLNDPEIDPIQPAHAYFNKEIKWWQHFNIFRLVAQIRYIYDLKRLLTFPLVTGPVKSREIWQNNIIQEEGFCHEEV